MSLNRERVAPLSQIEHVDAFCDHACLRNVNNENFVDQPVAAQWEGEGERASEGKTLAP